MSPNTLTDTAYLDGIRGLSALVVFAQHYAIPFIPRLDYGYEDYRQSSIFQLPIMRLFYTGGALVPVFFVIAGLTLSLKPISLIDAQEWEVFDISMVSMIFRRALRLFGPSLISSFVTMIGAYFGFFGVQSRMAYEGDPYMRHLVWDSQPRQLLSFGDQLGDWLCFVRSHVLVPKPWQNGSQSVPLPPKEIQHQANGLSKALREPAVYGFQLWTIPVEFWCSMLLVLVMTITSRAQQTHRILALCALTVLSMLFGRWDAAMFSVGSLLANTAAFNNKGTTPNYKRVLSILWSAVFALGLFLLSFPDANSKKALGYVWLSKRVCDNPRISTSVGAVMIVTATSRIEILRKTLSSPTLLYLGHLSYSLYMVHVPILSSFGWTIVPEILKFTGSDTIVQRTVGFVISFFFVLSVCVVVAGLYSRFIVRPCSRHMRLLDRYLRERASYRKRVHRPEKH